MAYKKTTWQNDVTPLDADNLNNIESGIVANETAIQAEVTDRKSAISTTEAKIETEAGIRLASDNTLRVNLTTETSDRKAADTTLTNNLNSEITNRKSADTTLTNSINSVSTKLTTETNERKSADTTLNNLISSYHPAVEDKTKTQQIYESMINVYLPIEITENDNNAFAYDTFIVNEGIFENLCKNTKITFNDSVTSSIGLFVMSDIRSLPASFNINNVTNVSGWFALCYNLASVSEPQHNNTITDLNGLCFYCLNLIDITWNMTGATDLSYAFTYCEKLKSTPDGDLTNCTTLEDAFEGCKALEEFNFTNINCSLNLSDCIKLSHDTLVTIISQLLTTDTAKTLTLGTTLKSLLSADEIKVATDKGWTVA